MERNLNVYILISFYSYPKRILVIKISHSLGECITLMCQIAAPFLLIFTTTKQLVGGKYCVYNLFMNE